MALNWDVSEIIEREGREFVWHPTGEKGADGQPIFRLNPMIDAMIWATISIGIGKITEANFEKVAMRLATVERLSGAFRVFLDPEKGRRAEYFTTAEVRRMIGLTTNVSTETDAAWKKRILEHTWREAVNRARLHLTREDRAKREAAAEAEGTTKG